MSTDEGKDIVEKWIAYLKKLDHPCVNILWGTPRIIDYELSFLVFPKLTLHVCPRDRIVNRPFFIPPFVSLVGSDRLESIWANYSKSPVLTQFDWSPVVHSGVNRNLHLLAPSRSRIRGMTRQQSTSDAFIPGLVSMHVRRGDYEGRTSHFVFLPSHGAFRFRALY